MLRLTRRQALASALIAAFSATRASAAYPDRPIRVVSPYAAGGGGENIMRLLAVSMEPQLGQKLIVAARPGAGRNLRTGGVWGRRRRGQSRQGGGCAPQTRRRNDSHSGDEQLCNQSVRDEDDVRSADDPYTNRQSRRNTSRAVFKSEDASTHASGIYRLHQG